VLLEIFKTTKLCIADY